ncbi:MAG: CIA30 family protein [Planctomycetes bacterium]|nr:CIA30 family protein [Planctomycetota bacterium]
MPSTLLPLALLLQSTAPVADSSAPAPLASAAERPIVRLFLLAGQSNMEGHAVADLDDARDYNGGRGNLVALLADPQLEERYRRLRGADGRWAVRDDVWVSYKTEAEQKAGPLALGFAVYSDRHHFGPELGLGHVAGDAFVEPVVLVKSCWGGKSLAHDFRPPSAGGTVGPCYTQMIEEYRAAVAALPNAFPALAGHAPRLDGFVWFQGWNDGCDDAAAAEYEENLVRLVDDLRREFGDARLPFVVGETGNIDNDVLRAGQRRACERPETGGGVRFVPTAQFRRPAEQSPNPTHGHHWFGNAESYLRIGDALGDALVELVRERDMEREGRLLTRFDEQDVAAQWLTVNDGVMGGKSSGGPSFAGGRLLFRGATNTDGGGFSSIRTTPRALDLSAWGGIVLRVRGDGRTYRLDLRQEQDAAARAAAGGREVAWRADFETVADEWREVAIPFTALQPSWRGESLQGRVPPFDPARIGALGLMIYDGRDGPFRLEVEWIAAAPR